MKKKIVSLCLVVALLAIAIVGGTFAYLQDTDSDINVMTSGNVKIVQNEQQRTLTKDEKGDVHYANDGTLEDFENDKTIIPAVYYDENGDPYNPTDILDLPAKDGTITGVATDNHTCSIYGDGLKNEVDKIISVTNNGTEPAYVRTIILFEDVVEQDADGTEHYVLTEQIGSHWCLSDDHTYEWIVGAEGVEDYLTIELSDGNTYTVVCYTYETELDAGATSEPSLIQFWLNPKATNDSFDAKLGTDKQYTILSLSQAVQADGFDSADVALDLAFGDVSAENETLITEWFNEVLNAQNG